MTLKQQRLVILFPHSAYPERQPHSILEGEGWGSTHQCIVAMATKIYVDNAQHSLLDCELQHVQNGMQRDVPRSLVVMNEDEQPQTQKQSSSQTIRTQTRHS